jgi:hypothetical protein
MICEVHSLMVSTHWHENFRSLLEQFSAFSCDALISHPKNHTGNIKVHYPIITSKSELAEGLNPYKEMNNMITLFHDTELHIMIQQLVNETLKPITI